MNNEYILSLTEYISGCLAITCEKQEKLYNCTQDQQKPVVEIEPAERINVFKSFI